MSNVMKPDNPFFKLMSKIGDIIFLNIIFVVSCLPIITIGCGLSSVHTVINKLSNNQESHIARDYILAFKENFKNSTVMWMAFLTAGAVIAWLAMVISSGSQPLLYIPYIFIITIYVFTLLYAFPLQAVFINTPMAIMRNALITAVKHLPQTILLVLIVYLPGCITLMLPDAFYFTFIYWVIAGFSLSAFISGFVYRSIFKLYMEEQPQ